jgi:hypothetical protein
MSQLTEDLRELADWADTHKHSFAERVTNKAIFTIERLESETKDLRLKLLDAELREAEARKR